MNHKSDGTGVDSCGGYLYRVEFLGHQDQWVVAQDFARAEELAMLVRRESGRSPITRIEKMGGDVIIDGPYRIPAVAGGEGEAGVA